MRGMQLCCIFAYEAKLRFFHFHYILKFFTEGDPSARGWFSRDPTSKIQYHVITNLITKKNLNLNTNTNTKVN